MSERVGGGYGGAGGFKACAMSKAIRGSSSTMRIVRPFYNWQIASDFSDCAAEPYWLRRVRTWGGRCVSLSINPHTRNKTR